MACLVDRAAGHQRPDHAGQPVGQGDAGHPRRFASKQGQDARIRRLGAVFGPADQGGRPAPLSTVPIYSRVGLGAMINGSALRVPIRPAQTGCQIQETVQ